MHASGPDEKSLPRDAANPGTKSDGGYEVIAECLYRRFNSRHRLWGRLFSHRYKAILTEGRDAYYHNTLMDRIRVTRSE